MKRCPHCGEDSFGIRELFGLSYFNSDECKLCGKPVRNDGLRQFLVIPTILFSIVLFFPLPGLMPVGWEAFALPLGAVLILVPQLLLAKPVKAEVPEIDLPPFTADPNNDKQILVNGWNEEELRRIIDDFVAEGRGDFHLSVELHHRDSNSFRLTFPEDISPWDFAAFLNYLAYPINYDFADREIIVAGQSTLDSDFGGVTKTPEGTKAIFYLPVDNEDYDVVFLKTDTGEVFVYELGRKMIWQRTNDPRFSEKVEKLSLEAW